MDASTLIDIALFLFGLTNPPSGPAPNDDSDPNRGSKPIG